MSRLLIALCTLAPACSAAESSERIQAAAPATAQEAGQTTVEFDHSYADWSEILGKHVRGDRLDYAALKKESAKLDGVLNALASVTPAQLGSWDEEQRFAYWINVYNAFCVKLVVDDYPIDSIRDLGGTLFGKVWDKEFIPLAAHHPEGDNDSLSLNDVEHGILRAQFKDARLHAAINCASISCPPLRAGAFTPKQLDAQLEEQMRAFVGDPRRNKIMAGERRVRISALFSWFSEDFERDAGSVQAYIARFAPGADKAWINDARVDHLDYDWNLNDIQ